MRQDSDLDEMSLVQLREEIKRLRKENNALEIQFNQQEQNIFCAELEIGELQQHLNALYQQYEFLSAENENLRDGGPTLQTELIKLGHKHQVETLAEKIKKLSNKLYVLQRPSKEASRKNRSAPNTKLPRDHHVMFVVHGKKATLHTPTNSATQNTIPDLQYRA